MQANTAAHQRKKERAKKPSVNRPNRETPVYRNNTHRPNAFIAGTTSQDTSKKKLDNEKK